MTPQDVLLMMAMQQLETGEKVDVIETLTSLGMDDIVEAAKIGRETEEEEEDELPSDDPEGDEIADVEVPGDSELGEG